MRDWKSWFKAALIRAVRTVAQTAIATIGTAAVISEVNWMLVLSASALSGILSILMSITGIPEEDDYAEVDPQIYRHGEDYNDEDI